MLLEKTIWTDVEKLDGIEMTKVFHSQDGHHYRLVRRSASRASVVGVDGLNFDVIVDGGGKLEVIEKGVIGTLLDWGAAALKLGGKLLNGECSLQNTQTATFDPKTGNMTGFTNTTTVVCPQ